MLDRFTFMTVFITTTIKDNREGTSLAFDADSIHGSPDQTELLLLAEVLTPKSLALLQQILEAKLKPLRETQPGNPTGDLKSPCSPK